MTQWIKTSEQLPDIDEPVLCMTYQAAFGWDEIPFIGMRIEKVHVPEKDLKERQKEDSEDNDNFNKKLGWQPGVCYEWACSDKNGYEQRNEYPNVFLILNEVPFWMPLPKIEAKESEELSNFYFPEEEN